MSVVTSWIWTPRLCFGWMCRSSHLTMHISPRSLMITNHGSPEWNCLIKFTIIIFTANNMGRQPMTSQHFRPLTLQTSLLAAAAIHCALSEYACGKKATVMLSQDEYRGTFWTSHLMTFLLQATALFNHAAVGGLIPACIVLATVPDRHFGSGYGLKLNRCQNGGWGCQ